MVPYHTLVQTMSYQLILKSKYCTNIQPNLATLYTLWAVLMQNNKYTILGINSKLLYAR